MLRLGWFSTGRGPGSRNLLREVMERKGNGDLDVSVSFVFCNWDNTEEPNPRKEQREMFFDMVRGYNIPLLTESWKSFRPDLWNTDQEAWRDEYGKRLREATGEHGFDLGILAGYMLWVDDATCEEYDMLNLHPALPDGPKGTWQEVIWKLMEDGSERQGAMMHICTPDWDRGAALTYCGFPIRGPGYDELWDAFDDKLKTKSMREIIADEGVDEPLFAKIRSEGARRELPLIVETIRLFADGKVAIRDKKLYEGDVRLHGPYDLSAEVDSALEG